MSQVSYYDDTFTNIYYLKNSNTTTHNKKNEDQNFIMYRHDINHIHNKFVALFSDRN